MRWAFARHKIISTFLDWWRDREDERLDELVAIYSRDIDGPPGLSHAHENQPASPGRDASGFF